MRSTNLFLKDVHDARETDAAWSKPVGNDALDNVGGGQNVLNGEWLIDAACLGDLVGVREVLTWNMRNP